MWLINLTKRLLRAALFNSSYYLYAWECVCVSYFGIKNRMWTFGQAKKIQQHTKKVEAKRIAVCWKFTNWKKKWQNQAPHPMAITIFRSNIIINYVCFFFWDLQFVHHSDYYTLWHSMANDGEDDDDDEIHFVWVTSQNAFV